MSFESQPPHEGNLEQFSLATRRVIRFSVAFLVVSVVAAGLVLVGVAALESGAADPSSVGTRASYLIVGMVVGLVTWACVIGLVVSTIVWIVSAHRVSPTGPGLAGYGGLFVALLLVALSYLLTLPVVALSGMRFSGWIVLVFGVVAARTRIRRETGRPDLGGRRQSIVSSDDWDASKWDPEVQRDIDRRGRPTEQ